jgi:hypothetical protein
MPNDHPAFRACEHVKFAKLEALEELQAQFGVDGPQGRKWIHNLLVMNMAEYAGVYVRIKSVSIYHFGTVLYEFDEVGGLWLEASIVDRSLEEPSGHDIDRPAHLFYQVTTDVESDQPGTVQIRGVHDQLLYCTLRKNLGVIEAKNITEVSRIRTKSNFEARYGFDGFYEPLDSRTSGEQDIGGNGG